MRNKKLLPLENIEQDRLQTLVTEACLSVISLN